MGREPLAESHKAGERQAGGADNTTPWFQKVISWFKPDSGHAWMWPQELTPCFCPLPCTQEAHFTLVHLPMQGLREAMGIIREVQKVLWDRNLKALAPLKADLPSFPLCHSTDCREDTHLPLAHMVATRSHLSAASMPWKHIGTNTRAGLKTQRVSPIQANLFANAECRSNVLAVLIQHDGLRDTPTTLKASQSVIIKAENTTDAACASKSKFCSLATQNVALWRVDSAHSLT